MSKPIPQIQKYMSTTPVSVKTTCPLIDAVKMMHEEGFRHLPVMDNGKLAGILTMTDVNVVAMINSTDLHKMTVNDVFHKEAMTFSPETHVDEVCSSMALHKYGCALVVDNTHLVGIFTWIDALKAMNDLLHTRLK